MAVSEGDRRRMDRLARALAAAENDEPADPAMARTAVAWADRWRQQAGLPPLAVGDEPPEEEFYRRARALGLRRRGR